MEQKSLKLEVNKELHRILEFWQNQMPDRFNGGFKGALDFYGNPILKSPKGSVLNTRIFWAFSAAACKIGGQSYQNTANYAYEYLKNNFHDKVFGGVYWMLDENGQVIQKRKQVYAQAFAIYGLTEYVKASGKSEALDWSIDLFDTIEKYAKDTVYGGYIEAFTHDWKVLGDVRLSEKDANEKKTMNTHLHILEAYTNLYNVCPEQRIAKALKELIEIFLDKFVNESGHLNLFFNEQWELKSDQISYGYDIEAAWLLLKAAEVLEDNYLLNRVEVAAIEMVDVFKKEGIDEKGGVKNEYHPSLGKTDGIREWWCQAEALAGLYNFFQFTGNKEYLETAHKVWLYIKQYFVDKNLGEWHWRVNEHGTPDTKLERAGFWKCPYHNARACMQLL